MKTYSIAEVVAMFGGGSDWWLREGMKNGRFSYLKIGRQRRFTESHVEAIAAELETRAKPQPANRPVDVTALGATKRSSSRHRNAS